MTISERIRPRTCVCILVVVCFTVSSAPAIAKSGIETSGDILQYVLPATAAGVTVFYRDKQGGLQLAESFGVSQGVTYGLKYGIDERRPNGGSDSMPSGHTSASFTAAEYMRKRYGWQYGVPAYAAATWVGYSRVESHNHWPKDVVVGAGVGIVSSYIFTRPYHGWKIEPQVSEKYYGVSFAREW